MLAYIAKVQKNLVTQYGFKAREDAPHIPAYVPDGIYPMEIDGRIDHVKIKRGSIFYCNYED